MGVQYILLKLKWFKSEKGTLGCLFFMHKKPHLPIERIRPLQQIIIATILTLHYIKVREYYANKALNSRWRKWNLTIWVLPLKNFE